MSPLRRCLIWFYDQKALVAVLLFVWGSACTFNATETMMAEASKLDSLNQYAEAIVIYDQILAIDSTNISALLDRAFDKGRIGDKNGEVEDLKRILKLDSTNTLAWFNLGIVYGNLHKFQQSVEAFNTALETKGGAVVLTYPNDADDVPVEDILLERGVTYYEMDSVRKAYFDLTYCISSNHKLGESYYYRGLTYLKSGMKDQACRDLTNAQIYGAKQASGFFAKHCIQQPTSSIQ